VLAGRCQQLVAARWAVPAWALLVAAGEGLYLGTTLLPAAFTGAAVFGAAATLFGLSCRAVIVAATPPAEHGRALSLWFTIQDACLALPAALTGSAVAFLGLRAVLDSAAALAGLTGAARAVRAASPAAGPAPTWQSTTAVRPRSCRQTVQAIMMAQYSLGEAPQMIKKEEPTWQRSRSR
jgi:hypothetical protein